MDKTNVANQGLINEMPDTTAKEGEEIQYTRAEDFLHPLTALADATYEGCVKSGSNQILVDIAKQWKDNNRDSGFLALSLEMGRR